MRLDVLAPRAGPLGSDVRGLPEEERRRVTMPVIVLHEGPNAIVFSYAHRPELCLRCAQALEELTDHRDPFGPPKRAGPG